MDWTTATVISLIWPLAAADGLFAFALVVAFFIGGLIDGLGEVGEL